MLFFLDYGTGANAIIPLRAFSPDAVHLFRNWPRNRPRSNA